MNGRTGPAAAAGEQILDVVPCDRNLVRVITRLIDDRDHQRDVVLPHEETPIDLPQPALDVKPDVGLITGRRASS